MSKKSTHSSIYPFIYSSSHQARQGFTLIELLVVVFIIGLLSSGITLFLLDAKKQARDTKRKADLQTIATALEMYYSQNKDYPLGAGVLRTDPAGWSTDETWKTGPFATVLAPYLSPLPRDPINGFKGGIGYAYWYAVNLTFPNGDPVDQSGYVIAATLEKPDPSDPNYLLKFSFNYFLRGGSCAQISTCWWLK